MLNIGSLYGQVIEYPHRKPLPIVEKGWTHEIDEPYRKGSCLVFRIPFTKPGFVLGWFGESQDETEALTAALWGRHLDVPVDELLEWD
jgi:hypothetical protein